MQHKISASDSTYHARHSARSLRRVQRIAANIDSAKTLLDVGCNNGITSQYLLDAGKAEEVTGIELHASTVAESLMQDSRFRLIEGDIAHLELEQNYDVCIYGAVHHHILNFNGLGVAIATLQKLTSHCDRTLFFETGQISEGGRWDWQRAIRRYFRTDEEHFYYLLSSIEHLVESYSIIGKFWIHGIRRSFFKIDLKPIGERDPVNVPAEIIAGPRSADVRLMRSCGSRNQVLQAADESKEKDSPCVFWVTENDSGDRIFLKQHRHRPAASLAEWQAGQSISGSWAVKPAATTEMPASLAFLYLDDTSEVSTFFNGPADERRIIAKQLLSIFSEASRTSPKLANRILLPTNSKSSLLDICDFNRNNFLVVRVAGKPIVRVVDFEQQSSSYSYRNRIRLASMLWSLRQFRLRALREFLHGALGGVLLLITAQAKSTENRVRDKQPSILSVAVAEVRSRMGAVTRSILDAVGYG